MVRVIIPKESNFFAAICADLSNKRAKGEIEPDFNFQISGALELSEVIDTYGRDLPNGTYSSKIRGHLEGGRVVFTERTVYLRGQDYQLRDANASVEFDVILY